MHTFRSNDIIILLGAGASVEAGIPHSADMIKSVEKLVSERNGDWAKFHDLYNCIRSSIHYSDGIRGKFDGNVNYNIERLVNTLEELSRRDEHTLYPFIGSWTPKLMEVAEKDFRLVREFRREIIKKLNEWIALKRSEKADYYRHLIEFQKEYQYPLRIFTLNYDLCVECACGEAKIEKGFDRESRKWDWRQFEESPDEPEIFLYKLHGSIDWQRGEDGSLTYVDTPSSIDEGAIIFGATYKLQYLDPFLFFAYQFRRWSLESKAIISIGYGFGDDHINGMVRQALDANEKTLLLSVSLIDGKAPIAQALGNKNQKQIFALNSCAQDFMENKLRLETLVEELQLPPEQEILPTIDEQ